MVEVKALDVFDDGGGMRARSESEEGDSEEDMAEECLMREWEDIGWYPSIGDVTELIEPSHNSLTPSP